MLYIIVKFATDKTKEHFINNLFTKDVPVELWLSVRKIALVFRVQTPVKAIAFAWKRMNSSFLPSYGLNNSTIGNESRRRTLNSKSLWRKVSNSTMWKPISRILKPWFYTPDMRLQHLRTSIFTNTLSIKRPLSKSLQKYNIFLN